MKHIILMTRPKEDAQASAEAMRTLGFEIVHAPVTEIRHAAIPETLPSADALVLTSPHALNETITKHLKKNLHCYCVGARAAMLCEMYGFKVQHQAANSAQMIMALRAAKPKPNKLLYLSGQDVSSDITAALLPEKMEVHRVITYQAVATDSLEKTAIGTIKRHTPWVVFYSKRSVELFESLIHTHKMGARLAKMKAFCLSETIARSARDIGIKESYSAQEPNETSLLALLAEEREGVI